MNFQVGDIAIIKEACTPYWTQYVGTECTILEVHPTEGFGFPMAYLIELEDGVRVGAQEYHLCKRGGDDHLYEDWNTKVEWNENIWAPEKVTVSTGVVT